MLFNSMPLQELFERTKETEKKFDQITQGFDTLLNKVNFVLLKNDALQTALEELMDAVCHLRTRHGARCECDICLAIDKAQEVLKNG